MFELGTKQKSSKNHFNVLLVDAISSFHGELVGYLFNFTYKNKPILLHSVYSAEDAVEQLKPPHDFDVVILDLVMQQENAGIKVLKAIQSLNLHEQLQVILVTDLPEDHTQEVIVQRYPVDDFISKDALTSTRLNSSLTSALRNHELQSRFSQTNSDLKSYRLFMNTSIHSISEAVVVFDEQGVIHFINRATARMFGYRPRRLAGSHVERLISNFTDIEVLQACFHLPKEKVKPLLGDTYLVEGLRSDGGIFPVELSLNQINAEQRMFICVLRDVTEMEDNKKKIYDLAFRDSLTGSFNIQKFRADMVEDELSNCYLLAFQLESFYFLTQAYGQDVSDNILLLLVHQISTQLPKHATLYRLEGVRFVVHCHTQGIDKASIENKALQLVELIRTAIEAPYSLGPNGHKLSAHYSIVLPDEGDDATSLLLKLELALNNAWKKKQKQNIYSERMLEEFFAKKNLEQSLLASIENEELYLQFQPQFRADGEPVSSEVLLRWNSKLYGFVSPDEFIPIAENNGFVIELTYWVIEQVFKTLDNIPIGLRHRVSINISPTDILQPNFSTFIADMLEKYDVSPDYIRLELTERIFVNDIERVLERMQFIIELGVSFSLDDFGTGYSSLSYLNILPIAELKIDKSFVDNVQNVGRSRSIVDTVVLLASALKLKCVAEGVESIEQVEHLKHYEGLLMQGYYFAKPMDKSVWLEYIFQSSKVINQ